MATRHRRIQNRDLKPGDVLWARHKGTAYHCEIGSDDDGLTFVVAEHRDKPKLAATHRTIHKAAAAVVGYPYNGWGFWKREDEEPEGAASEKRSAKRAEREAKPRKGKKAEGTADEPKMVKVIKRTANQQGLQEGEKRFFCTDCMAGFVTILASPGQCPQGHDAEAPATVAVA